LSGHEEVGVPPSDGPVTVRTYQAEHEAELARAVLEAHGIDAMVMRDNAGGMLPMLQAHYRIRLVVRGEDAVEAREILDEP
jgi:hypothetical protein